MPYIPPELQNLSLADVAALAEQRKLPPVDQWDPQHISDSKMQILSDGRWFHDGGEIKRTAMIRAFSSLLRKDDDGYWLVTPYEKQSIIVDDAPFIAVELNSEGSGKDRTIFIRINVDEIVVIGSKNAIMMNNISGEEPIPYIEVRAGLLAKCARTVAYELYEIAIAESPDNSDEIGLWSGGAYFNLSNS